MTLALPIAAVVLAAAGGCAPAGARAATHERVTATITDSGIAFAPSFVAAGTVAITVLNRTNDRRDLGFGARRTRPIRPGGSALLNVTMSGTGERQFSSRAAPGSRPRAGEPRRLTAALDLFAPCRDTSATTVQVQIDKSAGGLTLSPSTMPCGTVTFDVTDVDTPNAVLLVSANAPPLSGVTPQFSPGGTGTLTVDFPAAVLAHYSVVQIGGDGIVTVVGGGSLTVH